MYKLRLLFKKIIFKYFERFVGPYYFSDILRLEGIEIGEGTIFYSPKSMSIDRERPWMMRIGKYCKITSGVTILTHDYSRSVLRRAFGEFIGEAGMTIVGDNVFVGMNSIILMGSRIGDNCIVGAGSVVKGSFPNNVVIAGNPAKVICTLEEYYEKRKSHTVKEAKVYVESFRLKYGTYPDSKHCGPFFSLYENRETFDYINDHRLYCNGDNHNDIVADFKRTTPMFSNYNSFIEALKEI